MESEKVKEIKKALKQNIKTGIGFLDEKEDKIFFVSISDILTLITELESEKEKWQEKEGALSCDLDLLNEKLTNAEIEVDDYKERIVELETLCNKTYEDLTKEIDRLEKEMGEQYNRIVELEQDLVHADENVFFRECTVALKENEIKAKALKQFAERLKEQAYDSFGDKVIWYYDIDETLKEFIKGVEVE